MTTARWYLVSPERSVKQRQHARENGLWLGHVDLHREVDQVIGVVTLALLSGNVCREMSQLPICGVAYFLKRASTKSGAQKQYATKIRTRDRAADDRERLNVLALGQRLEQIRPEHLQGAHK